MLPSTFTEDDAVKLRQFVDFTARTAYFELSIPECIELNSFLVNIKHIIKKIEDHICEIKDMGPIEERKPQEKKPGKGKLK